MEYVEKVLQQSGIKGQRKGVRRFQYPNGTLTPEGRLRYLNHPGNVDSRGRKTKDGAIRLSNRQLKSITERINLEKSYLQARQDYLRALDGNKSKGRAFVEDSLGTLGGTLISSASKALANKMFGNAGKSDKNGGKGNKGKGNK